VCAGARWCTSWRARSRNGAVHLGQHQHVDVRLDLQRSQACGGLRKESRAGLVSTVGVSEAKRVHGWRGKRPRAIMHDMKGLCADGLPSKCPPCCPALAGSRSVASTGALQGGGIGLLKSHRAEIYAHKVCQGTMARRGGTYRASSSASRGAGGGAVRGRPRLPPAGWLRGSEGRQVRGPKFLPWRGVRHRPERS
jgi:hypothetical protein